jgi:hypothetical protein
VGTELCANRQGHDFAAIIEQRGSVDEYRVVGKVPFRVIRLNHLYDIPTIRQLRLHQGRLACRITSSGVVVQVDDGRQFVRTVRRDGMGAIVRNKYKPRAVPVDVVLISSA